MATTLTISKFLENAIVTTPPVVTAARPMSFARTDHRCFGCGEQNPIGLHLLFAAGDTGVEACFKLSSEPARGKSAD